MMQDGGSLRHNHNRYSDSTVIRLTKTMKSHNGKVYIGLRFFDLPIGMQDYIIVDVTMVIENGMKKKLEMITENYRLHVHVTKEMETNYGLQSNHIDNDTMNATTCKCVRKSCECCMTLNVVKIGLNDFVRNPPSFCLSLPFLKEYANVCLRLYNLEFRQETLDGCIELGAELYHVHVATVHLGCFSLPI
ncbi:unnamed protein product [Litomosoides sigmodontis]|uniref:DUF4773 domain-containing protein n=1 Tax=Litomosoides sigmodontis TaxID=42156 RepID=A0A3P6SR74_LITSI|nr:unnamed protein product [Litomosoides sigmodontis]